MHPTPLVSFTLFGKEMSITLYGICIAVGLIVCLIVLKLFTDKRKMKTEVQDFAFFVGIVAIALGFVGAMLFQSVYNWIETGVWEFGSVTAMGGFISGAAVFIAAYFAVGHFYFKKGKLKNAHVGEFNTILQVAPMCITIAHAFGRIGCLMAGCCHGAETDSWIGMSQYIEIAQGQYAWRKVVPVQLFEAVFLFILAGVLFWMYWKGRGFELPVYFAGYGVWRFIIEYFRTDDRGATFVSFLTPSQLTAIVLILVGIGIYIAYFVIIRKKGKTYYDGRPGYVAPPEKEPEKKE